MAPKPSLLATWLLSSLAAAQQIGTAVPEHHPKLPTQKCTLRGGCKTVQTSVVLDAFSRSLHKIGDTKTGCTLGSDLCTDAATCGKNCALEGIDYAAHGLVTKGDALTMNQWRKAADGSYTTVSPRAYLLAENEKDYEDFKLLNAELSFDVDVSKLVCGMNGALYFSEMEMDGGRSRLNPAGAAYGTGYCDAQCPKLDFINGEVSLPLSVSLFSRSSAPPVSNQDGFSNKNSCRPTPTTPTAPAATRWTSWKPMLSRKRSRHTHATLPSAGCTSARATTNATRPPACAMSGGAA